ncbi:hypothetical protein RHMOL_Rhmol07G0250000 [Rhododendron molle]|uniref:Uncharacterized protein n=1 Tax=Rhododendron molle TaxID=49168 RepID=A0ACC0N6K8_RHOML|nr:hypothetical protein RHMOL_Rhmol07G0250000 [Rhododendron molle]
MELLVPSGFLLVTVNGLGVLSESIYVILYLIYAPKDKKVKTMILVGFLNIALVGSVIGIAIAVFDDEGKRRIFMGVVCAAVTIAMYVAPLEAMVPNAIGIATSSSQILLYMIYENKSPLSNLIGSIQATDQKEPSKCEVPT